MTVQYELGAVLLDHSRRTAGVAKHAAPARLTGKGRVVDQHDTEQTLAPVAGDVHHVAAFDLMNASAQGADPKPDMIWPAVWLADGGVVVAQNRWPAATNGMVGTAEDSATMATSPKRRTKGNRVGGVGTSNSPALFDCM